MLFIHRNTVRYRLSQAEERLGYSISESRAELTIALRWLRVMEGSAATA